MPILFELDGRWPLLRPLFARVGDVDGALLILTLTWDAVLRPSVTDLAMFAPRVVAGSIAPAGAVSAAAFDFLMA